MPFLFMFWVINSIHRCLRVNLCGWFISCCIVLNFPIFMLLVFHVLTIVLSLQLLMFFSCMVTRCPEDFSHIINTSSTMKEPQLLLSSMLNAIWPEGPSSSILSSVILYYLAIWFSYQPVNHFCLPSPSQNEMMPLALSPPAFSSVIAAHLF